MKPCFVDHCKAWILFDMSVLVEFDYYLNLVVKKKTNGFTKRGCRRSDIEDSIDRAISRFMTRCSYEINFHTKKLPSYRAVEHTWERLKQYYDSPSTSLFVVDRVRSLHVRGIPKFRGGCKAYAHHVWLCISWYGYK